MAALLQHNLSYFSGMLNNRHIGVSSFQCSQEEINCMFPLNALWHLFLLEKGCYLEALFNYSPKCSTLPIA
jgi:hypothetical protein